MANVMTVDDYIDGLDEHLQEPGRKLRDILDAELTAADSIMWEDRPTWVIGKVPVAAAEHDHEQVDGAHRCCPIELLTPALVP
ncbi:MAG TPA: hypothetical protein VFI97_01075 [Arthrobacter sp.]|nr:hypothetical protein [Arthrobacter sp.]